MTSLVNKNSSISPDHKEYWTCRICKHNEEQNWTELTLQCVTSILRRFQQTGLSVLSLITYLWCFWCQGPVWENRHYWIAQRQQHSCWSHRKHDLALPTVSPKWEWRLTEQWLYFVFPNSMISYPAKLRLMSSSRECYMQQTDIFEKQHITFQSYCELSWFLWNEHIEIITINSHQIRKCQKKKNNMICPSLT